ncbi:MAG: hypothetical protein AAF492_19430 [Verrucomicrobiota bacterium]
MLRHFFFTGLVLSGLIFHAHALPPVVDQGAGAVNIGQGTATLTGTLSDDTADVFIFWGPADGGTDPAAWAQSEALGRACARKPCASGS